MIIVGGAKGAIVYSSKPRLFSPALQCPAIYPDSNVLVQGDTENSIYRNSVQFSCRYNNQILSGQQEIICNEHGEWSGTVPKCIGTASLLHTLAKCLLGICVLNLTWFLSFWAKLKDGIIGQSYTQCSTREQFFFSQSYKSRLINKYSISHLFLAQETN